MNKKFSPTFLYVTGKRLEHIIQEYRDVFPEQLHKGIPPARAVEHTIKIEPGSKSSYRHHTGWVLLTRTS